MRIESGRPVEDMLFRGLAVITSDVDIQSLPMLKRYLEISIDVAVGFAAYFFFGWIGFALWALFVVSNFCIQLVADQRAIMQTLLSRLPDRCALCHREIVDEGGVLDEDGIYHDACADKLDSLEGLRKEAGVPLSEATHRPRVRRRTSAG